MLFKRYHVGKILMGEKTQTRRIWKRMMVKKGNLYKAKTEMISPLFFAYIKVLKVFKEKLGDISEEDAIKEGYTDINSYLDAFFEINKISDNERQKWLSTEVDVVEFEVIWPNGGYLIHEMLDCTNCNGEFKFKKALLWECSRCHSLINIYKFAELCAIRMRGEGVLKYG